MENIKEFFKRNFKRYKKYKINIQKSKRRDIQGIYLDVPKDYSSENGRIIK